MKDYRVCAAATAIMVVLWFPQLAAAQENAKEKEKSVRVAAIRKSLTFWASFDAGTNADVAKGDKQIYTASSPERKDPRPGLPAGEIDLAKGEGRRGGDALRFIKKSGKVTFYKAAGNVDYRRQDWSGTASFWLSLDPQTDLGDWYCDPIQITEKTWNDAALWVDFSKDERPKHFRLGALADLKVWNPGNRDFEKMTPAERPMYVVSRPEFARGKWTQVAITFENFNTGKPNGVAKLYLDGKLQGAVSGRNQLYSWNMEKAAIQIGMGYVGLFDDLALFDRALNDDEVQTLFLHEGRLTVEAERERLRRSETD
jgi:Concanavalin A-like lectin/glucanases superfamily